MPRAQRGAAGPGLRRARDPPPARAAAALAEAPAARGLPARRASCVAPRRSTPSRSRARRCGPTGAPSPGRSTSSATSTAASTSWSRCWRRSATRSTCDGRRAPRRAAGRVRRRPRRPRARVARRAAARDGDGRRRRRALRARQPRRQARPQALRGRDVQITHGLAESLAQLGRRAAPSSAAEVREFLDGLVSHDVLDDGRLVVAHAGLQGDAPGPRLRRGARVRAVRRDHRRDRRVRPAGPLRLGRRVPRPRRPSSTATLRSPSRSGSTTRSTSTPAACSAAG